MASVTLLPDYDIEYSTIDGSIREFSRWNDEKEKWEVIDIEKHISEFLDTVQKIKELQSKDGHGYSKFIYKLANEGIIIL